MDITETNFYASVQVGDLVEIEGDKDAVDKTSLTLAAKVEFEESSPTKSRLAAAIPTMIVFVIAWLLSL